MKVILLKSIPKIGKKDEIVEVSDGYATNALFPSKSAIAATPKNKEALQRNKQSAEDREMLKHELLKQSIASIPGLKLTLPMRATNTGHLFSKVDEEAIVKELEAHRISISPKNIVLPENIKQIGTYTVQLKESSYRTEITLDVVAL